MRWMRGWIVGLGLVSLLAGGRAEAHGRAYWSVGIGFGGPGCCRPWCGWPVGVYYRPYPVYLSPAPVYVAPYGPYVVPPAPVVAVPTAPVAPAAPSYQPPPPTPLPAPQPLPSGATGDVDYHLRQLASPDERVRLESVQQLGRLRSEKAIDSLAATLAGDRSAAVRDAAARALGLIGSRKALPALQMATYNDSDRDVRRSAEFAVEVIQSAR